MRLVATMGLSEGVELAKPIYNDKGKILIQKNIILTKAMIKRLIELNVSYVYIKDDLSDDIVIHSPIPEELKIESIQMIKSIFDSYKDKDFKNQSFLIDKSSEKMATLIDNMMRQIQQNEEAISILSDIFICDDYLFHHSVNVSIYSIALANQLQWSRKQIQQLGLGAILHDVGKVFLPDEILKKAGKLTDQEFEMMKTHTELGFEFLRSSSEIPLLVAHCAYQHHERLNGSGYPRGIINDEIHAFGKVLGIADVFDAMTTDRVYRKAMLPHEALETLYAGSGTLFDAEMVRLFRSSIAVYPNGVTVQLSDNRHAIVIRQNNAMYNRPVVRVISEGGQSVPPYDLDLNKHLDVMITGYIL
ncbi:HD-GYP domain-containing protein [Amphibacillus sediminis]|uniref:HD-GYP domain-containing protein n=1 Tax=Amphibacillus sediminis TaxID=360185 RepID=UPI000832331E|nr:HD-GYP domain-containing protein [Amphibacillus sediminis]